MLQLHDLNKLKIKGLKLYKDYCIESDLSSGDKTLSFLYPAKLSKEIIEECYIRTKTDEFVVKEINNKGDWKTIVAKLNVEDLEGKAFEHFDTSNETITACLNLALAGTGWTLGTCDVTRRRTVRKTNSSSWEIIQEAKKNYRVELEFNTLAKKINIFDKRGSDKGVYFSDTLNLRDIDIQGDTHNFYTRIIAIGKDDIKVTLDNFQYSTKVKTFIWKDDRYTDINALREDAASKLNEISKPYRSYNANVIDLANTSEKYKILNYEIGDTITIVSKEKYLKEKQRIVKMVEYPEEPERNSCEIANVTLRFEDIQKEFKDTSDTVNNITKDDGTVDESTIDGLSTSQIYDFEASVGKITDLTAVNAKIENLYAEKASVGQLNAVIANIGELNATKANITDLNATNATIANLEAITAKITDLNVIRAKINVLEVDTASIKNLLAGNITGENIHAGGITSDKLTIANGFITNAMIANLDVAKINAGIIYTEKFVIRSADGGIEIIGATQQFKDKNNKVRIQMGKDAQGNFNFILRGEDGTTALIDHTGIKKDAIADDLIVKDMIAGDAVGEKHIDYNSFSEGFNKDTNTTTIKGTKIKLDNQNQTLDIAFNQLKTQADGTKTQTESNSTTIGIQQGQITTAINNTQIIKDGQTILLKDDYNRTVATVDSMKSTIGTHTSLIDAVTGKVTGVENKVNIVERDLNGTISTVTSNTSSINGLNSSVTSHTNQIAQLQGQISLKVEKTDITNAVNNINVGGRNNYSKNTTLSSYDGGVIQTSGTLGGFPITNGFGITGKNGPTVMLRISNVITGNGEWTISFDAISNGEFNLVIDTCDLGASTYRVKTTTTKIVHTVNVTNYSKDVYNFIDLNNIPWIYLVCSNVKVEKGNKATDWTPSLEDVSGEVDTKINSAKAEIKMTTDSINFEVSKKTDKTTIISTINQTAEAVKISASKLELNGYVTITNLSTPGQTIIDGGNIRTGSIEAIQIKACHFSGKNMVYIEDGGILSCDGHAYLKNLFIPETHPGWLPGTIGSFSCAPTAWFDRDVQVANEIYTRGTGVVRRQVGVFIQVDALGIQNTNDKNWLLINGYQSPHAFGVDLWMSDENLKEEIYEINTNKRLRTNSLIGLDLVTQIQHYRYNYKKSLGIEGYSDCGYVSQQLEELNKNLIIDVKQADGTSLKQPVASAIIPQLSLAIQQQQEIIQRQQDEINRIKEQLLLM